MVDHNPGQRDERYLEIILRRIRVCKLYKPKFGQGQGVGLSLDAFQQLYGGDPFYSWFGLDHPLMYAAHKAAGGITSVYRQIGTGCEELFRQLLRDQLGLSEAQTVWSYSVPTASNRTRVLSLDGRFDINDIQGEPTRTRVANWLRESATQASIAAEVTAILKGAVFEVRQGYKSKDSKRQNADIANATTAIAQGYLPVVLLLSTQIDNDIVYRYQSQHWLILRGYLTGTAVQSTYTFARDILGYDLAGFFERNHAKLKAAILDVLETLLSADE